MWLSTLTLTTALAAVNIIAPPALPPIDPAAMPLIDAALQADIKLLRRLDEPFATVPSYVDRPAKEIVEELRRATKVPIEIDRRALGDAGGWEWLRVTCEPATPRAALHAVLRAISPAYELYQLDVASGIVVVTDRSGMLTLRATAQYDFTGIIARLPAMNDPADNSADEFTRLENYLLETIEPETWVENGGDIGRLEWVGTVAQISTTPAIHKQIQDSVTELKKALPTATVLWTLRVMVIDPATDEATVRTAFADALEMNAVVERKQATMLSAPRLLVNRTEEAKVVVENGADKLEVTIAPPHDRVGKTFTVAVRETRDGRTHSMLLQARVGERAVGLIDDGTRRVMVEVIGVDVKPEQNAPPVAAKPKQP
jgi:hypothetical protein